MLFHSICEEEKCCFWIRSSRSTNACRISAFGLASVIHRHPHTEQANASPSNDNNLDIETAFSITEDICADQFILDESYNNKSTTSACTTDVKSVPGRLVTRKKTEIGEVDKAILKSVNSFHKSIIAGQKKKRESDDEVELFYLSLVATLRRLRPCEKVIAKIQVQQLLFKLEFLQVMSVQQAANSQINTDGNGAAYMHEKPYF